MKRINKDDNCRQSPPEMNEYQLLYSSWKNMIYLTYLEYNITNINNFQLNIVQGLSQFGVFLHKLEFRERVLGNASNHTYK